MLSFIKSNKLHRTQQTTGKKVEDIGSNDDDRKRKFKEASKDEKKRKVFSDSEDEEIQIKPINLRVVRNLDESTVTMFVVSEKVCGGYIVSIPTFSMPCFLETTNIYEIYSMAIGKVVECEDRIVLTDKLKKLNENILTKNLKQNMKIIGRIAEEEDNGYMIDFGMKSLKGFFISKKIKNEEILNKSQIMFNIDNPLSSKNVIQLSQNLSSSCVNQDFSSIYSLTVGTSVKCVLKKKDKQKLYYEIIGHDQLIVLVPKEHLAENIDNYPIGNEKKIFIIYIRYNSTLIVGSMKRELGKGLTKFNYFNNFLDKLPLYFPSKISEVQNDLNFIRQQYVSFQIIRYDQFSEVYLGYVTNLFHETIAKRIIDDDDVVVGMDSNIKYSFIPVKNDTIKSSYVRKAKRGLKRISCVIFKKYFEQYSDETKEKINELMEKETNFLGRILHLNLVDGTIYLNGNKKLLKKKILNFHSINLGDKVKGKIKHHYDNGLSLELPSNICAFLHYLNAFDSGIVDEPKKLLPIGKLIEVMVTKIDEENRRLIVTRKKKLLKGKFNFIFNYSDAERLFHQLKEGNLEEKKKAFTFGVICHIVEHEGMKIQLTNPDLSGWLPMKEISTDVQRGYFLLSESFKIGEMIKCGIKSLSQNRNKIILTSYLGDDAIYGNNEKININNDKIGKIICGKIVNKTKRTFIIERKLDEMKEYYRLAFDYLTDSFNLQENILSVLSVGDELDDLLLWKWNVNANELVLIRNPILVQFHKRNLKIYSNYSTNNVNINDQLIGVVSKKMENYIVIKFLDGITAAIQKNFLLYPLDHIHYGDTILVQCTSVITKNDEQKFYFEQISFNEIDFNYYFQVYLNEYQFIKEKSLQVNLMKLNLFSIYPKDKLWSFFSQCNEDEKELLKKYKFFIVTDFNLNLNQPKIIGMKDEQIESMEEVMNGNELTKISLDKLSCSCLQRSNIELAIGMNFSINMMKLNSVGNYFTSIEITPKDPSLCFDTYKYLTSLKLTESSIPLMEREIPIIVKKEKKEDNLRKLIKVGKKYEAIIKTINRHHIYLEILPDHHLSSTTRGISGRCHLTNSNEPKYFQLENSNEILNFDEKSRWPFERYSENETVTVQVLGFTKIGKVDLEKKIEEIVNCSIIHDDEEEYHELMGKLKRIYDNSINLLSVGTIIPVFIHHFNPKTQIFDLSFSNNLKSKIKLNLWKTANKLLKKIVGRSMSNKKNIDGFFLLVKIVGEYSPINSQSKHLVKNDRKKKLSCREIKRLRKEMKKSNPALKRRDLLHFVGKSSTKLNKNLQFLEADIYEKQFSLDNDEIYSLKSINDSLPKINDKDVVLKKETKVGGKIELIQPNRGLIINLKTNENKVIGTSKSIYGYLHVTQLKNAEDIDNYSVNEEIEGNIWKKESSKQSNYSISYQLTLKDESPINFEKLQIGDMINGVIVFIKQLEENKRILHVTYGPTCNTVINVDESDGNYYKCNQTVRIQVCSIIEPKIIGFRLLPSITEQDVKMERTINESSDDSDDDNELFKDVTFQPESSDDENGNDDDNEKDDESEIEEEKINENKKKIFNDSDNERLKKEIDNHPDEMSKQIDYVVWLSECGKIEMARKYNEKLLTEIIVRKHENSKDLAVFILNFEGEFGDVNTMKEKFYEIAQHVNNIGPIRTHLVRLCENKNELECAEEILKKAATDSHQSKAEWIRYGLFLYSHDRIECGRNLLKKILSIGDVSSKNFNNEFIVKWAQMEFRHGDLEQAKKYLDGLIHAYPSRISFYLVYLDCLVKYSDSDMIRAFLHRHINGDVNLSIKQRLIDRWLSLEEKWDGTTSEDYYRVKALKEKYR
ncbi:hypothetical protein SNEBB_010192 [Seison nebaliae]|nr:hypothetical protein SNEBB_010192 [Seison nebaliae]